MAPHPPLRRRPWAPSRCLLGRPGCSWLRLWQCPPAERPSALRRGWGGLLDGVGELCPWRRGHVTRAAGTQLGPFTSHPQQQQRQARRRRRAATTPLDGVGERSPARRRLLPPCGFSHRAAPPRGDGCCRLVVSVTGPEAMGHCCGARETAQAPQHGCGDDCSRSASLAALHARPRALH